MGEHRDRAAVHSHQAIGRARRVSPLVGGGELSGTTVRLLLMVRLRDCRSAFSVAHGRSRLRSDQRCDAGLREAQRETLDLRTAGVFRLCYVGC